MAIDQKNDQPRTIEEIQAAIFAAKDNDIIQIAPGRMQGRLVVDRAVTLRGAGPERTILDGRGRGVTIAVEACGGTVHIEEMTIMGGKSQTGGGIAIDNGAEVRVTGCLIEKNAAKSGRGGAIAVDYGSLYVSECTIVDNRAFIGGAIYVGGDAKAEIAATIVADNFAIRGGAICAADGAEVDVYTSRFENNVAELEGHHLYAFGAQRSRPHVLLSNALLGTVYGAGMPISNHARYRAAIAIDNSAVGREINAGRVVG